MKIRTLVITGIIVVTAAVVLFSFLPSEQQNICEQIGGLWNSNHCMISKENFEASPLTCDPGPVLENNTCNSNGIKMVFDPINSETIVPSGYDLVDKLACESRGGSYFIGGEYVVCQVPVNDEGKMCTDSSQCEDICKAETIDDIEGICTVFSHGCDLVLNDGEANWLCSQK